ncbi:MAG: Gfo/Idh/MocA family oxidoreductase [Planctomycetales bacterium]|nr:Gfo/Idh/MocA family oxidoreductase [Planctomycetales bacterium]
MSRVRLAVIGAGHLGKIHARLACRHADAELTLVADPDATGAKVAAEHGARHVARWEDAADDFDGAIVAAPTSLHDRIGESLLRAGKHVLMEKPICDNSQQAGRLVHVARNAARVLQVGHVERFNPAFALAAPQVTSPHYVEATREGPYTGRSTDVGVVLDLMIHDLDLVLSVIRSPVQRVSATGMSVVGPHEDAAHAWIEFADGAVATLRASRVSAAASRSMQVIGPYAQAQIDMASRSASIRRPSVALAATRVRGERPTPEFAALVQAKHLPVTEVAIPQDANPLLDEQANFIQSIRDRALPVVTGEDGLRALAVAEEILDCIAQRQRQAASRAAWPLRTRAA